MRHLSWIIPALFQREHVSRAKLYVLTIKPLYTQKSVNSYPCQFAHVADTYFGKLLVVIMHHAFYCRLHLFVLPPCIKLWVLCPKYFRFLFTLCNVLPYAWCPWLYLPYLAMYLILRHDNQGMTVLSFLFGHIWRISCRWFSSTLVFSDRYH